MSGSLTTAPRPWIAFTQRATPPNSVSTSSSSRRARASRRRRRCPRSSDASSARCRCASTSAARCSTSCSVSGRTSISSALASSRVKWRGGMPVSSRRWWPAVSGTGRRSTRSRSTPTERCSSSATRRARLPASARASNATRSTRVPAGRVLRGACGRGRDAVLAVLHRLRRLQRGARLLARPEQLVDALSSRGWTARATPSSGCAPRARARGRSNWDVSFTIGSTTSDPGRDVGRRGVRKPDPAVFRLALERSTSRVENCTSETPTTTRGRGGWDRCPVPLAEVVNAQVATRPASRLWFALVLLAVVQFYGRYVADAAELDDPLYSSSFAAASLTQWVLLGAIALAIAAGAWSLFALRRPHRVGRAALVALGTFLLVAALGARAAASCRSTRRASRARCRTSGLRRTSRSSRSTSRSSCSSARSSRRCSSAASASRSSAVRPAHRRSWGRQPRSPRSRAARGLRPHLRARLRARDHARADRDSTIPGFVLHATFNAIAIAGAAASAAGS